MPPRVAVLVSARMATLAELDTIYGAEDMYNMLEILAVDRHNRRVANEKP